MRSKRSTAASGNAPLPAGYTPQLATLVSEPPQGDSWLHELKYDGYRIGCRIDRGTVRLLSRNGKDWTARFSVVSEAAQALQVKRALLDGEVVVVLPDGRTSFQALQNSFAGGEPQGQVAYFVFDVLHIDGEDLTPLPLEERKARLKRLLGRRRTLLRYSDHYIGHGAELLAEACRKGAEGIVSKRRDLKHQPGRGTSWLKIKCIKRQEFVIGGFTDPEGARVGIGALLVGVRNAEGALAFAGKVGTGFTQSSARALRQQLEAIEQDHSAFTPAPRGVGRNVHWVRPQLVGEVAFTEWTSDGKIRHPSFQGLRADKSPAEVVRERPTEVTARAGAPAAAPRATKARTDGNTMLAGVRITHPERVLYPETGVTKLELAKFYEAIGEWILPHVADRPLTLVRCPQGIGPSCFYMKHVNMWAPASLRRVRIREKTKIGEYLVADSLAGLIGLVQMDILEIHTWNSTATHLEKPDRIVLDLDPGPAVAWPAIITAARLVREALTALGLQSFVKTTGGRGLHVVAPLRDATWETSLAFAHGVAQAITRVDPSHYTIEFAKAGREAKILIDYLRNNRTNTSIAAFSTRARPGAPVSTPLAWEELSNKVRSDHYSVRTLTRRLARLREDPWADYWTVRQHVRADASKQLEKMR